MRIINLFIIFLIVLATVLTIKFKPEIHKSVIFDITKLKMEETKQEDEAIENKIEWNNWHSNLVNLILKEQKPDFNEPIGTVNYIEFTVDNKGNIFNINVKTEPAMYTQKAKIYYSEFLPSLSQNKILQFPSNSQRKTIKCKFPMKISKSTVLSTPQDFSDIESLRK